MREIKFRVYDVELRVMYTPEMDAEHGNLWSLDRCQGGVVDYPNGYLMQYTGLKDKNGKEIYEGDLMLNRGYNGDKPYEVYWHEGAAEFTNTYNHNIAEIVGNIYENPELLEDVK